MALKHIKIIFLLFLSLHHLLPAAISNAAKYRFHGLGLDSKSKQNKDGFMMTTSSFLAKGMPIPPSRPSRQHNRPAQGTPPLGSFKAGDEA